MMLGKNKGVWALFIMSLGVAASPEIEDLANRLAAVELLLQKLLAQRQPEGGMPEGGSSTASPPGTPGRYDDPYDDDDELEYRIEQLTANVGHIEGGMSDLNAAEKAGGHAKARTESLAVLGVIFGLLSFLLGLAWFASHRKRKEQVLNSDAQSLHCGTSSTTCSSVEMKPVG